MRGHIARRGDRYYVVVDVRDADGSRRRKWHSGFASRREAEAFLAKTVHELATGRYVEPSRVTVGSYLLDEWLPASAARVRPTTLASYQQSLTTLLLPILGDVRLAELSPVMLTKLYGELLRRGSRHPAARGPLKARTVRYLHTIITRALNDAVRWQYLQANPAAGAMPPSASAARAPEMKTWTAAQLRAFLDLTADDPYGIAYRLAGCCGLCRGEACGLRWADVDLDGDEPVLRVRQQLVEVRYEIAFTEPKARAGRRTIALDPHTVAVPRGRAPPPGPVAPASGRPFEPRVAGALAGPAAEGGRRPFARPTTSFTSDVDTIGPAV